MAAAAAAVSAIFEGLVQKPAAVEIVVEAAYTAEVVEEQYADLAL